MDFHPKDIPIYKTYDLSDEKAATEAAEDMAALGFKDRDEGFKVLMPKDPKLAKRIGYTVTTGVTYGLRQRGKKRDVKYWTYHHDADHYAIVFIDGAALSRLGF